MRAFPGSSGHVRQLPAEAWDATLASLPWPIKGEALKRVPRGLRADHLEHKSWFVEVPATDSEVTSDGFCDQATDQFAKMCPLNEFLNQALVQFKMPQR
ncbi:MAG: DUF2461 domain-containing protein [Bifidobacteriaceae bacterium]|nr:DUF2461 domain-containing protein [Bifidobacteriaceae bacterium]